MALTKHQEEVLSDLREWRSWIYRIDWEDSSGKWHTTCRANSMDPRGLFTVNVQTVRALVKAGHLVWDARNHKYWLVEQLRDDDLAALRKQQEATR